jgi:enamine deaminase RidA (YjgF/YER057c/UK114 family)
MSESSQHLRQRAGHAVLQPTGWPRPKGFSNGMMARGDIIVVSGMVGNDAAGKLHEGFVAQTRQTLENIAAVLAAGGAEPRHVVRMTWYVLDMNEYVAARAALGPSYRAVMGDHFPAMTLVEVNRLVEPEARLEIEAMAVVPLAE